MARTVIGLLDTQSSSLVTAANAALAALTNPTIRGCELNVWRMQRRPGVQYRLLITYDTGGAVLATPFTITLTEAATMAALVTALNTAYAAAVYFSSPQLYVLDTEDQVHTPLYGALSLTNATAGATANAIFTNVAI